MSPSNSEHDDADINENTKKVEAEYATPPKTTKKLTEKQLENLKKMRENKLNKSKERKAKKQEDEYIERILTEKEEILLQRLKEKLQKENRNIEILNKDEPVKPRSARKPKKESIMEQPKPKEPEAPEPPPPPPQKPHNPFMHLF
jgi:hypothetical protein